MSSAQAIVDVALILCAVVTWVVLWRRDSVQQEQIDALKLRLDGVDYCATLLERERDQAFDAFDAAARRLEDDARRIDGRRP